MQWVLAAVAAAAAPGSVSHGSPHAPKSPVYPVPGGYGADPNLVDPHKSGAFWPLTFTAAEHKAAKALADVIIPKDPHGPAASSVGVVEMLDEWVSAPYPDQVKDRPVIVVGLAWIDGESVRRFAKPFAELEATQQHAICDDICFGKTAKADFKIPARFFSRFRSLAASAYYATPAGWDAIGYVGNVPLTQFDGPPPAVLKKLGVTQTVL